MPCQGELWGFGFFLNFILMDDVYGIESIRTGPRGVGFNGRDEVVETYRL